MKSRSFVGCPKGWLVALVTAIVFGVSLPLAAIAADPQPFDVQAMYVEGCSCHAPCSCQLTGGSSKVGKCEGVNAVKFTGGHYRGADLKGAAFAFATEAGNWTRVYVDARPDQREAATELARKYASAFGAVEEVRNAPISIEGEAGRYTLKVGDGKIMTLVTEPIMGGDGQTPLVYQNIHDPLHSTVKQGRVVSATFRDGEHAFELKGSNAYFNEAFETKGKM